MKKITFLHTADLHLDSPMVGLSHLPDKIYNRLLSSTFVALRKLVDTAIEYQVDFMIVAGDIYDGEDRSIRAQVRFRQEMERLANHGIPVYVTHGNHDHLGGKWTQIALPDNVHVFGEEVEFQTFKKHEIIVHIYGFSYPRRQVLERKIDQFIKVVGADYHIGILHGNDGGNSAHGNYAPFLVKDLLEKQFDYWALGHIHKSKILSDSPPILYPGNIQGRHHKEQGRKGCYLATLNGSTSELKWIDTADVEWETFEIDVKDCFSFEEIYHLCIEKMNLFRSEESKGKIVKLELKQLQSFPGNESIVNGDLMEVLQDAEREEEDFIWVSSIQVKEDVFNNKERLLAEDGFFRELVNTIDNYKELDIAIESLFSHPQARKHLQSLSNEEQNNILKEAERILVQLIYEKGN
jgi:DNA repair protein SbcD/Mre11